MSLPPRLTCANRYRRLVLDMHIPDREPGLLARFDPERIADLLVAGRIDYATIYAQSCTGHCYWPTAAGKAHAATRDRDLFGSLVAALRKRGIFTCAYYSVVFNNLIADHPDWRIRSRADASLADDYGSHRYGQACPNNAEYRARVTDELTELLGCYEFDAMFFDMAFWRPICLCPACIARCRDETGRETPAIVDWHSAEWCRYQETRERWNAEFQARITALVKGLRPGLPVVHNAGGILHGWPLAVGLDTVAASDFLSGDFYGDHSDQRTVGKLLGSCTPSRPPEIMTTRCTPGPAEHVQTKDENALAHQAAAVISCGAAASIIDGINPDGTLEPAVYEMIGRVYAPIAALDEHLGGEPLADVGLYFSDYSKMSFAENGRPAAELRGGERVYPHLRALRGACEKLQQGQVPFAVVSRRQLAELSRFRVLLLPNVLRMTADEVEAIRAYVAAGGRLYASRMTSLNDTRGRQFDDFALADVFGCHYVGEQGDAISYLRPCPSPVARDLAAALAPQACLSVRREADGRSGMVALGASLAGQALALRTAAAYPEPGSVADQRYISLHSSPPWRETDEPVLVQHRFGRGEIIYSAGDIEAQDAPAAGRAFLALIRCLAGSPWTVEVQAHPCVWVGAFHQAERRRVLLLFANYPPLTPALPVPTVGFTLQPVAGPYRCLVDLPGGGELAATRHAAGAITGALSDLDGIRAVAALY